LPLSLNGPFKEIGLSAHYPSVAANLSVDPGAPPSVRLSPMERHLSSIPTSSGRAQFWKARRNSGRSCFFLQQVWKRHRKVRTRRILDIRVWRLASRPSLGGRWIRVVGIDRSLR